MCGQYARILHMINVDLLQLKWLQWPGVVCAGVWYTLRPASASARALELTKAVHLPFIKYLWGFFDCRKAARIGPLCPPSAPCVRDVCVLSFPPSRAAASRYLSSLVMAPLDTFKEVTFDGVSCHVFSDGPVCSALWTQRYATPLRPCMRCFLLV